MLKHIRIGERAKTPIIISIITIIGTIIVMPFSESIDAQYIAILITVAYIFMFYSWKRISCRIELYILFLLCTYLFYYI